MTLGTWFRPPAVLNAVWRELLRLVEAQAVANAIEGLEPLPGYGGELGSGSISLGNGFGPLLDQGVRGVKVREAALPQFSLEASHRVLVLPRRHSEFGRVLGTLDTLGTMGPLDRAINDKQGKEARAV